MALVAHFNFSEFVKRANEKGFDAVAALSLEDAKKALDTWKSHLRNDDNYDYLATDPRDIISDAACVLVLAYPYRLYKGYPDGVGRVSGYYVASNRAFHALSELVDMLCAQGVHAAIANKLPHKPLAFAGGLGRYGNNGLIVRRGAHIVLGVIVINVDMSAQATNVTASVPDCDNCKACEKACPTGCLQNGYVNAERCLRSYMTSDIDDIPDDLMVVMGERLIGCDDCMRACSGLVYDAMPKQHSTLFSWDALADKEQFKKNKSAISELIGKNNANALHKCALRYFRHK